VDVLSSRILLRPGDLDRSLRFYRDVLGLAVYREFGPADHPGMVFFLGQGLLEVSGSASGAPGRSLVIWIQVRDVREEHARLATAGVPVIREPVTEPWGLVEMWIEERLRALRNVFRPTKATAAELEPPAPAGDLAVIAIRARGGRGRTARARRRCRG
jgi:predicted enzyme related to lactoylglutathione lyase